MDVKKAYDLWSSQYDTNSNKTRDLEAKSLQQSLQRVYARRCLEIGCGTGKNTQWLIEISDEVTAVDFSTEMIARAKAKVQSPKVQFVEADISLPWLFVTGSYDLVIFSLVLEHLFDLNHIFNQVAFCLQPGGIIYVGELHPFKQYVGSKAKFDTGDGVQHPECFRHHISDFVGAAKTNGLILTDLSECFENNDRTTIPRLLTLFFSKPG
jgi:ubiquinone/menaquinone biosynthesis C-methylase UbiE